VDAASPGTAQREVESFNQGAGGQRLAAIAAPAREVQRSTAQELRKSKGFLLTPLRRIGQAELAPQAVGQQRVGRGSGTEALVVASRQHGSGKGPQHRAR